MKTTGLPVMKMPVFFLLQLLYPFPNYSLLEQVKHYEKIKVSFGSCVYTWSAFLKFIAFDVEDLMHS